MERRTLKTFGVRVGAHSVWLPALLKPRAQGLTQAHVADQPLRATPGALVAAPDPLPAPRVLSAFGLRAVGPWLVPVEALERMAELAAERQGAARPVGRRPDRTGMERGQGRAAILNALQTRRPSASLDKTRAGQGFALRRPRRSERARAGAGPATQAAPQGRGSP